MLTISLFLPFIRRINFCISNNSWGIFNAVCLICELFAHFLHLFTSFFSEVKLCHSFALTRIILKEKIFPTSFLVCILKFIFTKGFLNFERDRSIKVEIKDFPKTAHKHTVTKLFFLPYLTPMFFSVCLCTNSRKPFLILGLCDFYTDFLSDY